MSTILTNKIETKSGGLTLDAGAGNSINIVGDISGYATTEYVDTAMAGSGGSGLIASDRVNVNKQALKLEYLQRVFDGLDTTDSNVGRLLDNAVSYDSSHVGIVTDIFDTSSNLTNTTNVTVNDKLPINGFGNVQLQQDILPYGTEISEKLIHYRYDHLGSWNAVGVSSSFYYENYEYSIFSYMYSPDGTKLWAFVKNNYSSSYYVSVVVEFDLSTPFDISSFDRNSGNAVVEHELTNDPIFGNSGAYGDEFNIHYDPELNVVRLIGRDPSLPSYVFIEYQVTGQSITGVNRIISQGNELDRMTNYIVPERNEANGTFNGDGTKFVTAGFNLRDPYILQVTTFDVSSPFSTDSSDFSNTGDKIFYLGSSYPEFPNYGFVSDFFCPLVRVNQAGDKLSIYQVIRTDTERLYSFEISLSDFVVDSNSQIVSESSFEDYSTFRNLRINSTLVHGGDLIVSNNVGRFEDLEDFDDWYYIELNASGLGDIQTPGTFERSIDLTNDLDSSPTSVVLTQQDSSSDANVTISVEVSDGTNTVTINALDTEVDCSALTSRTLTATWNLSVADIQGTNAKIENYALNFR